MHDAAYDFVASVARGFAKVVEIGSLDINGSVRGLFPGAAYVGLDRQPGPGVDIVADVLDWHPGVLFDCCVCCEVLEHLAEWRELLGAAHHLLASGGMLILTAAGPGRGEHSAVDGNALRPGEHYGNIDPDELRTALEDLRFTDIRVETLGLDVRATAVKP